ncbi:hypothetical protein SLEP1_g36160 [Rubroshorea leprosula]|uniref:PROP1-like PPR domain-containing protein n=1 Tax=Rubroshorea leprosula TaxID=152421 RepID=A0AAV5KQP7_9ROSI|nr:hypothetical protein SLEP1_g36160 [Rubroshorea leprosula]
MALFSIARRLRRTHPQLLLSFPLKHPNLHLPSLLGSSEKFITLSLAFHRTHPIYSRPAIFTPHFSTLQSFSTQTLTNPFDFTGSPTHDRDPQEPALLDLLKRVAHLDSETEAVASLDNSGIKATQDLIFSVIWTLREEWRLAFLAFKWGEKWSCSGQKACELMVWILGNHSKFNIAWCLIRDLYHSSMDTRRAMFIMIDRYAAANDPCKAIRTFHIMEKFRMTPDEEAFQTLLKALCKHGNIEEAEELMLSNKKLFPLETESFNIILNGWCTISVDVFEAKRVWREMSKCCVTPDATSYTLMICCFSKVGNLFDSLRLYDEMKKRGWAAGIEVYNSLVYVLTRDNCLNEAHKILDKMREAGSQPDSTTYNSMIRPLCEAAKVDEARNLLSTMISEKLSPTVETYHAFLEGVDFEGTLEFLNHMRMVGLCPTHDTFLLVLGKFFKIEQPENALKIWTEMEQFEIVPDYSHYITLIKGLATCGWLVKARELYAEMMSNGFLDDPKLKKLLQEPVRSSGNKRQSLRKVDGSKQVKKWKGKMRRKKSHHQSNKDSI